jgi:hypothetical protein
MARQVKVRRVQVRQGKPRCGRAWDRMIKQRPRRFRCGSGMVRFGWPGAVRQVVAWQVWARHGQVRPAKAWRGRHDKARDRMIKQIHHSALPATAGNAVRWGLDGKVGLGPACLGAACLGAAGYGSVRRVLASLGWVRSGRLRRGKGSYDQRAAGTEFGMRRGWPRHGASGQSSARLGSAGCGRAGSGLAWSSNEQTRRQQ